eukprot:CAMPEP_0206055348 /NCGR_PEP_ID=MMETSP1466-20131121/39914_1 /ASSEMBLY_ACC=CAM_ASM_001126 /TAXON_ID=44452 /ORGANISM="Pavlova gyrans, Strain CCMP608" /LENGTH=69 /DNA_ID=CAMNT_0053430571 /DNA_START=551 /DNA_END=760 /DNA_ORIENTATION=+
MESCSCGTHEKEDKERSKVALAYAPIEPDAVMIEPKHAKATLVTVLCSLRTETTAVFACTKALAAGVEL